LLEQGHDAMITGGDVQMHGYDVPLLVFDKNRSCLAHNPLSNQNPTIVSSIKTHESISIDLPHYQYEGKLVRNGHVRQQLGKG
jgi:hypothetical protein